MFCKFGLGFRAMIRGCFVKCELHAKPQSYFITVVPMLAPEGHIHTPVTKPEAPNLPTQSDPAEILICAGFQSTSVIHPRRLSPTFKAAGFAEVAVSNCSGIRVWGL